MKMIRLPLAMIALVVAVLLLPIVASADNAWSKYHWDLSTAQSAITPLPLGNNLTTSAWTSSLGVASSDWNASVLKNAITAGSGTACEPVLGGVEVCNGAYGNNGWLGIAQVWVYRGRDGHIAQGLVQVNDTYFVTDQYDSQAWRDFVVCQEVGHTLGLSHQDETYDNPNLGTCMDYTNDPDGTISDPVQLDNRHPNQHDLDVLTEKYGHLNGITKGGGGKGGGKGKGGGNGGGKGKKGEPPGQNVRQWGKAISTDGKGRPDLFELDLGNGDKVFTHVLWAN
jgi:hypothetical protein